MDSTAYKKFKQAKAIEQKNKQRLLEYNDTLSESSGIYFLLRVDEDGIKYAYIGQAKHILTRLAQHLVGYQHIDLSLKKHGLISADNPYGWNIHCLYYPVEVLDTMEQHYIKKYAQYGYQLRNKTAGGQGKGKSQIDEYKPSKGYRDGLEQGYRNASKEVANYFEKHLNFSHKSDKPNKNQDKAEAKFVAFMNYHKESKHE